MYTQELSRRSEYFQADPDTKYDNPFIYVYLKTLGTNLLGLFYHSKVDTNCVTKIGEKWTPAAAHR